MQVRASIAVMKYGIYLEVDSALKSTGGVKNPGRSREKRYSGANKQVLAPKGRERTSFLG